MQQAVHTRISDSRRNSSAPGDSASGGPTLVQRIKDRLPLLEYASRYTKMKPSPGGSGEYFGKCPSPSHEDGSPSFYVNTGKNVCHCKGCGFTGNVIQLHSLLSGLEYDEAKLSLGRELGVYVERNVSTWESLMSSASRKYTEQLLRKPDAMKYLESRGISQESIEKFGLGFCWGRELQNSPQEVQDLALKFGLARKPEGETPIKSFMAGRLTFPIRDRAGRVVGFTGRIVPSEYKAYGPKYMNTPETAVFKKAELLYGIYEAASSISRANEAFVVEGNADVVMLHQVGVTNSVGVMGAAAGEPAFKMLWDIADRVVFCLDGDKAGIEGTMRSVLVAAPTMTDGKQIAIMHMPEGVDPDEFVVAHGVDAFRALGSEATPLSCYLIEHAASKCDLTYPEGRAAFLRQAKELADKFVAAPMLQRELMAEADAICAARLAEHALQGRGIGANVDEELIRNAIALLQARLDSPKPSLEGPVVESAGEPAHVTAPVAAPSNERAKALQSALANIEQQFGRGHAEQPKGQEVTQPLDADRTAAVPQQATKSFEQLVDEILLSDETPVHELMLTDADVVKTAESLAPLAAREANPGASPSVVEPAAEVRKLSPVEAARARRLRPR